MLDDDRPFDRPGPDAERGLPRIVVAGAVLRLGDRYPVRGASLTVRAGEMVGLVGGPGSGRSTLLHLVAGLHAPTFGIVEVGGRPPHTQAAGAASLLSARDLIDNPPVMAPAGQGTDPARVVPPVVLLDEPMAGRTGAERRRIWRSLSTARRLGAAVLVTLGQGDLYDAECDRIYLMLDGATVAGGETARMTHSIRAGIELGEGVLTALR